MPLNTSYTLDDLHRFLLSTQRGELIGRYFKPTENEVAQHKPLKLIIDDSVEMFQCSTVALKDAEPHLRDRYHPNTGIAQLRAIYGNGWEPNLDHSNIIFYIVRTVDEMKNEKLHTECNYESGNTHYYVQETKAWYYRNAPNDVLTKIRLTQQQVQYLTSKAFLNNSSKRYQLKTQEIQHFIRSTNSYEFLHMGWEKKQLSFRDLQEQLVHCFIDCCFVMKQTLHINFTSHPAVIIDFSEPQSLNERFLEQNHRKITDIFNIGLSRLSLPLESLNSIIEEKKDEYSKCTYVGLTREKRKLTHSIASNDVIHIEPFEIEYLFLPLKNWLKMPIGYRKQFAIETEEKPTTSSKSINTTMHIDPQKLEGAQKYVPPFYRSPIHNQQSPLRSTLFGTAKTSHYATPPSPTGML